LSKPLLAVVDDDPDLAGIVASLVEDIGFDVEIALGGKSFQKFYEKRKPDAIIMDLVMPDIEGIELLNWLSEKGCASAIIIVSGFNPQYLSVAEQLGSHGGLNIIKTFTKPVDFDALTSLLENIIP
jgi:DNA-binding response OmpR family regulator